MGKACLALETLLSISLPFEFLGPVPGKFMVGAVGHLIYLWPVQTINFRKRNQQQHLPRTITI